MDIEQKTTINWFPGHMVTALKMISEEIKLCDAIIYLLDARCPLSCLNPKFADLVARRPALFVLNKADIAPRDALQRFRASTEFKAIKSTSAHPVHALSLDSTRSGSTKTVVEALHRLLQPRIDAGRERGLARPLRAIVIGVTNTGKSTLINNLAGSGKTKTENRPGVTRTKQWVGVNLARTDSLREQTKRGNPIHVLDTPGTLYPKFDELVAKNLAYIGSIRDQILDTVELARLLIDDLELLQSGSIAARYSVDEATVETIALKRGLILKGGAPDSLRAATMILTEFRAGKLGAFNLDLLVKSGDEVGDR